MRLIYVAIVSFLILTPRINKLSTHPRQCWHILVLPHETDKGSEGARDTGKSSQRTWGKVMPEGNFTGWSDPESSREVFPADGMA